MGWEKIYRVVRQRTVVVELLLNWFTARTHSLKASPDGGYSTAFEMNLTLEKN